MKLTPYEKSILGSFSQCPQEGSREMVLDVVCNMEVNEKTAKWRSEYKGKTYYFCAPMCKQKFDRNPEKYIKSK